MFKACIASNYSVQKYTNVVRGSKVIILRWKCKCKDGFKEKHGILSFFSQKTSKFSETPNFKCTKQVRNVLSHHKNFQRWCAYRTGLEQKKFRAKQLSIHRENSVCLFFSLKILHFQRFLYTLNKKSLKAKWRILV